MFSHVQFVNAGDTSEDIPYRSAEIDKRSIQLAADGTGIIRDFSCHDCGFKVLKVSASTEGYLGNAKTNVSKLIKQSRADVGVVKYAVNSNAVYEIRFSH
jgi:hypothetical protein